MPDEYDQLLDTLTPRRSRPVTSHLDDLISFAKENKLAVGSTTGGTHNVGSKHYSGNAIDIRGSGSFSNEQVNALRQQAAQRGLLVRDERTRPQGQKVWGGPHVHIEYTGQQADEYDTLLDSFTTPQPKAERARKPSTRGAQVGVSGEVQAVAGAQGERPARKITSRADVERPLYEAQRGQPATSSVSSDELRVMKGEQPVDRQAYARQQEAQTRLSGMRDESYRERVARETQDIDWRKRNQAKIDAETERYRKEIRRTGVSKWLNELGAKAAGGLAEFGAPVSDTLKIKAEAAIKAAQAEGADRSALSKLAQDIPAGFISSIPELAAMKLGAPPAATFAAGSALRAGGQTSDPIAIAEAAGHGGATGLAYETGAPTALRRALGTGVASTGIELASGASPREAITSGAVNALMRRLGEVGKSEPIKPEVKTETKTEPTFLKDAQGTPIARLLNPEEVAQGAKPRVRVIHQSDTQPRDVTGKFTPKPKVEEKGGLDVTPAPEPQPATVAKTSGEPLGTAAPIITRERAFPKSAEAAGLPQGTDLAYAVNTDVGAVERANTRIKEGGTDKVARELLSQKEPSKDDIVAASIAAHEMTAKGDLNGAIDLIDDMARKLTSAGQSVQAASLISRLSPEGVLLAAQRRLPEGKKLTREQASSATGAAAKVRETETRLSTLEAQINEMRAKLEKADSGPRAPRQKIGTLEDRLVKMEAEARARLDARKQAVIKGSQAGASTIPLDIADFAIVGATKLARKGVTFTNWSTDMLKEFGEEIKPHLRTIYNQSYKLYDEQRKQFQRESQERGVRRSTTGPFRNEDIDRLINQRIQARKDAASARRELGSIFQSLNQTRYGRVKTVAADVLNVPRTIKASVDLSGPRQAAMFMVSHPVRGAKLFFGRQLGALREKNFDRYKDELQSDPDFEVMRQAGLDMTSLAEERTPMDLTRREEAFMSRIAAKIPGVKHSNQAYAQLLTDSRVEWFKQLKEVAETKQGSRLTNEQYRNIADFVNIGTGRGNLGRGQLNKISPFLNAMFFAPKYAASKLQVFDPRVYARLPPGARAKAVQQSVAYFGAMATSAMLMKYGMGLDVGLDPEQPDFMKLKVGNTRYDLTFGQGTYAVLAARLTRNLNNKITGEKDRRGMSLMETLDRFLRYKYAPIPGAVRNVYEGKNPVGEPTDIKSEAVDLIKPLFLDDVYKAYMEEGAKGVGKTLPGFVGVGVQTYKERPKPTKAVRAKR